MARKIPARPVETKPAPARPLPAQAAEDRFTRDVFLGLALILLTLIVFSPAFGANFIWDDDQLLTANPQVHSASGWWTLWVAPATADYFPLTSSTLWLEYHLGHFFNCWNIDYLQQHARDWTVNGYHIMNVLFHATAVLLTWRVLVRLRLKGAWFAAALFAVHPICVESVAWISERKNTLAQIFFLLSLLSYLKFEATSRVRSYVTAIVMFLLSLLAKTSVVMLPFVLLLLAWWKQEKSAGREQKAEPFRWTEFALALGLVVVCAVTIGCVAAATATYDASGLATEPAATPPWAAAVVGLVVLAAAAVVFVRARLWQVLVPSPYWRQALLRTLPFFAVAFVLGVITVYFQYGRAIGSEVIPIGNFPQRLASACFAVGFYLYSALWPFNIVEIYPQWHRSIPFWLQVVPGILCAALLVLCAMRRERPWARAILFGVGFFLITMLPALGLLKMSYMRLTLVADHFQYLSIIGIIALLVGWACSRIPRMPRMLAGAALLLLFSVFSFGQTELYQNEETLWTATLEKNPNSWQAHNHLGAALYSRGDVRAAAEHFVKAVRLKPDNPEVHNNLALVLGLFGHPDEAIHEYETAVRIKDDAAMRMNLANAYAGQKRFPEAIASYQDVLKQSPDNPMAHYNLGVTYMQLNRLDEAIHEFQETLRLAPNMQQAAMNLNAILQSRGTPSTMPASGSGAPDQGFRAPLRLPGTSRRP